MKEPTFMRVSIPVEHSLKCPVLLLKNEWDVFLPSGNFMMGGK
jgi:hypothetical protein